MTNECEHCGTVLPADHVYLLGQKIGRFNWNGWGYFAEDLEEGEQVTVPGVGVLTMVAKSCSYGESQGDDDRPVFMIMELNGVFYRKNGVADSYGEVVWSGAFKEAVKRIVTKEEWV